MPLTYDNPSSKKNSISERADHALVPYLSVDFPKSFLEPSFNWIYSYSNEDNEEDLNEKEELAPSFPIHSDLLPIIFSYCDAVTLSRSGCVCKEWQAMAMENALWESLCRHSFGVSAKALKPSPDPVEELYVVSHQQLRTICRISHSALSNGGSFLSYPTSIPMASFHNRL